MLSPEIIKTKKQFEKIRAVLVAQSPFVASLMFRMRVIADTSIPVACVDKHNVLHLNPVTFLRLPEEEQVFVISHETLHVGFCHVQRGKGKIPQLWNIAADAVVNYMLEMNRLRPPKGTVTLDFVSKITGISREELQKMKVEEIYNLLEQHLPKRRIGGKGGEKGMGQEEGEDLGSDLRPESGEEDKKPVIQEGDQWSYEAKSEDEIIKKWKENVASALLAAKRAGNVPGNM